MFEKGIFHQDKLPMKGKENQMAIKKKR